MSKIQKPRQKFYTRKQHKRPILDVNLKGFLCTCNNREKDCVKESYNILNKYADLLYPPQQPDSVSKDDADITDELKNELLECRATVRRFQVADSGAKNMIFIKTTLDDPVLLAEKIITDIAISKSRQTRMLIRLVPIEITCKAYVKDIINAFKPISAKYFTETARTFSIVYNHRNNNNLKREEVIKVVADLVFQVRSDHKVDLKEAEISIIIEVIKGIALIGIAPNFIKYKKYNLHSISEEDKEVEKTYDGDTQQQEEQTDQDLS